MTNNLLVKEIDRAWEHAVLAYNTAQNSGLKDTMTPLAEVIVKLSQQKQFAETMFKEPKS